MTGAEPNLRTDDAPDEPDRIARRIDAAALTDDPTPFAVVEPFLDQRTYLDLMECWPAADVFEPVQLARYSYSGRSQLQLSQANLARLPARSAAAWRRLSDALSGPPVLHRMLAKFAGVVGRRVRDAGRLIIDVRLSEDRMPYALGPHTDADYKVLSTLIYMPEDSDNARFGTAFYRPLEPGFEGDGSTHYDADGFEEVAVAPFRPNAAVIFPRTATSFHGVRPLDRKGYVRRAIVHNIYVEA